MSGNHAGVVIESEGNPIIANPGQIDFTSVASQGITFRSKLKVDVGFPSQSLGGGGTGGGGIGTYFGSGAPSTTYNDGDYYFDTSTDPYTMYVQRSSAWVQVYSALVPPDAPVLTLNQPITSLSSVSWLAVSGATSYNLQMTNIDLDPTYASPVINLTGITDLSYALETFFRNNTILETGYSGSLDARIATLQMLYNGHIYGDWVYFGATEAYTTIVEWGLSGSEWLSNLIVNMSEYIYGIRVQAVNGAGVSAWTADGFQPQFAPNQLTVNTVTNVDGQVITFNTDYGDSMNLRFDQPSTFGTYYFKSNIGNPVHGAAAFKTLNFTIVSI